MLRAQFVTSFGHVFEAYPEESFMKPLRETYKRLARQS